MPFLQSGNLQEGHFLFLAKKVAWKFGRLGLFM